MNHHLLRENDDGFYDLCSYNPFVFILLQVGGLLCLLTREFTATRIDYFTDQDVSLICETEQRVDGMGIHKTLMMAAFLCTVLLAITLVNCETIARISISLAKKVMHGNSECKYLVHVVIMMAIVLVVGSFLALVHSAYSFIQVLTTPCSLETIEIVFSAATDEEELDNRPALYAQASQAELLLHVASIAFPASLVFSISCFCLGMQYWELPEHDRVNTGDEPSADQYRGLSTDEVEQLFHKCQSMAICDNTGGTSS